MSESRRGAVNPSTILMMLAVLVAAGFFAWLFWQSQLEAERQAAAAAAAAAEAEAEEEPDISMAETVDVGVLGRDMSAFDGQLVRLEGVAHGGGLGAQGFFANAQTPFLVSAPLLVADTANPVAGRGALTLVGTVRPGGEDVFAAWLDAGTIGEGDLAMASFVDYYVDLYAIVNADGTAELVGAADESEGDGGEESDDESGS